MREVGRTAIASKLFDAWPQVIVPLRRRGQPFSTVLVSATMSAPVKSFLQRDFPDMKHAETSTLHRGIIGSNHVFLPLKAGGSRLDQLQLVRLNPWYVVLHRKEMITRHHHTLHQRCLITDATVIPNHLPQSEHPPETTTSDGALLTCCEELPGLCVF